jgi:hypothetical protein
MCFEVNVFGWLWKFPNIQFPIEYELQYLLPFVVQNTLFSTCVLGRGFTICNAFSSGNKMLAMSMRVQSIDNGNSISSIQAQMVE